MKNTALFLALMISSGATASAEVTKVYLQLEGCLRATCSRKVWQALGRTVQSSSFKVDDAAEGTAEFIPAKNAPLNLRALNKSIHDAGYRVKRVAIEVDGNSTLAVANQKCSQEAIPQLWLKEAQTQKLYEWTPSVEDLKRKTSEDVQVCVVH
jgi:hypothetical protein